MAADPLAEGDVVHNYPRESKDDHFAARDCPCNPREIPWLDGVMVIHRRPPAEERRRFKELFGDRRG